MKNIQRMFTIVSISVLTATTPVWAHLPDERQMAHVGALAHQLADAVHSVHVAAKRSAHHNKLREEKYTLRKLHNFDNEARLFHREVERRHHQPLHTLDDFAGLIRTFREAKYALGHAHAFRQACDFDRVERLVFEISDYYGGRYHRPSTHRHWYQWYPYDRDHH